MGEKWDDMEYWNESGCWNDLVIFAISLTIVSAIIFAAFFLL